MAMPRWLSPASRPSPPFSPPSQSPLHSYPLSSPHLTSPHVPLLFPILRTSPCHPSFALLRSRLPSPFSILPSPPLPTDSPNNPWQDLYHIAPLLSRLASLLGQRVLGFDYPGYGAASGSPSEAGCFASARAAYDYARKLSPQVLIFGRSLGSGPGELFLPAFNTLSSTLSLQSFVASLALVCAFSGTACSSRLCTFSPRPPQCDL